MGRDRELIGQTIKITQGPYKVTDSGVRRRDHDDHGHIRYYFHFVIPDDDASPGPRWNGEGRHGSHGQGGATL